jgi:hypothetical protein
MRVFIFVIKWLKKVLPPAQQSLKLSTTIFDSPDHTNISHVTYGIVYGSLKKIGSKNPNYFSTCFGILFYF